MPIQARATERADSGVTSQTAAAYADRNNPPVSAWDFAPPSSLWSALTAPLDAAVGSMMPFSADPNYHPPQQTQQAQQDPEPIRQPEIVVVGKPIKSSAPPRADSPFRVENPIAQALSPFNVSNNFANTNAVNITRRAPRTGMTFPQSKDKTPYVIAGIVGVVGIALIFALKK